MSGSDPEKEEFQRLAQENISPPIMNNLIIPQILKDNPDYDWSNIFNDEVMLEQISGLDDIILINLSMLNELREKTKAEWPPEKYGEMKNTDKWLYDQIGVHPEAMVQWIKDKHPAFTNALSFNLVANIRASLYDLVNTATDPKNTASPAASMSIAQINRFEPDKDTGENLAVIYGSEEGIINKVYYLTGLQGDKINPEWRAELVGFVALHEIAHGQGQRDLEDFFNSMDSEVFGKYTRKDLADHTKEIDSDLSAFQVLQTSELKDRFIGRRFITSFSYYMMDAARSPQQTDQFTRLREHDTAYFLKFYDDNGYMPNYFQACLDVDGFYSKTFRGLQNMMGSNFTEDLAYNNLYNNSFEAYASVVNTLLASDPPVYSANEEMVARQFLECLEANGTEVKPLNEVRDSINLEQSPLINPIHTKPDTIPAPKQGGNR